MRILYLDEDKSLVSLLTRLLERRGCRVSGYTDARAALAEVRARPGDFDLVITDHAMPGMSGLEVATALRRIRPDLPVVLACAYITEEVWAQAPAAGICEIIHKSKAVEELCDTVARLAAARRSGRLGKGSGRPAKS